MASCGLSPETAERTAAAAATADRTTATFAVAMCVVASTVPAASTDGRGRSRAAIGLAHRHKLSGRPAAETLAAGATWRTLGERTRPPAVRDWQYSRMGSYLHCIGRWERSQSRVGADVGSEPPKPCCVGGFWWVLTVSNGQNSGVLSS